MAYEIETSICNEDAFEYMGIGEVCWYNVGLDIEDLRCIADYISKKLDRQFEAVTEKGAIGIKRIK